MSSRQVNEKTVREAMQALTLQGKTTTIRALHAHIGFGSLSTIAKYRRRVLDEQPATAENRSPAQSEHSKNESPAISLNMDELIARIALQLMPLVDQHIQSTLDEYTRPPPPTEPETDTLSPESSSQIAILQARMNSTLEELQRRDVEFKELKQLYRSVLADRAEKIRTAITLKNKLVKTRADLTEYEAEIARLQAQSHKTDKVQEQTLYVVDVEQARTRALELAQQGTASATTLVRALTRENYRSINKLNQNIQKYHISTLSQWIREWKKAGLL